MGKCKRKMGRSLKFTGEVMGNVSHVKKLEEAADQLLKVWEYLNEPEKEVKVSNITYFNKSLQNNVLK
jgi:hypothetical protein